MQPWAKKQDPKGLAPRGASGLKCFRVIVINHDRAVSRPARGEWIEITMAYSSSPCLRGLAPRGASGLKCQTVPLLCHTDRLAPRGASGLKCVVCHKIIFGKGLAHREASGFPATGAVAPKYSPEGYEPVKRIFDGLKGPDSSLALGIPPFLPAHSHRPMCSY